MHVLFMIALGAAMVGTLSSTVFLILALAGAGKFARARRREQRFDGTFTPGVTIFKPLHGMEPQLQRNLESFFEQDYAGAVRDPVRGAHGGGCGAATGARGGGAVSGGAGEVYVVGGAADVVEECEGVVARVDAGERRA